MNSEIGKISLLSPRALLLLEPLLLPCELQFGIRNVFNKVVIIKLLHLVQYIPLSHLVASRQNVVAFKNNLTKEMLKLKII